MRGRLALAIALFALLAAAPAADAYIYWSSLDAGNSRVGRADLDGTNVNPALVDGISLITGVASDGTHVYWTQTGAPTAIGRATVNGGSVSSPSQSGGRPRIEDRRAGTCRVSSRERDLRDRDRRKYTAIGDATNMASRIEAMTKGTAHQLFVSGTTREQLADPAGLVFVERLDVRGRSGQVEVWADEGTAA